MRVFERFATDGGHAVEMRYEPPADPTDHHTISAACTGCPATHGPGSQYETTRWSQDHARRCTGPGVRS